MGTVMLVRQESCDLSDSCYNESEVGRVRDGGCWFNNHLEAER